MDNFNPDLPHTNAAFAAWEKERSQIYGEQQQISAFGAGGIDAPGFLDTSAAAISNGVDRGITKAFAVAAVDLVQTKKEADFFKAKYPDAPVDLFDKPMSEFMARHRYTQWRSDNEFQGMLKEKNSGFFGHLGYSFLGTVIGDPAQTVAAYFGPAMLGKVARAAAPGLMGLLETSVAGSKPLANIAMKNLTEEFIVGFGLNYLGRKATQGVDNTEYTTQDMAVDAAFGTIAGTTIHLIGGLAAKRAKDKVQTAKDVSHIKQAGIDNLEKFVQEPLGALDYTPEQSLLDFDPRNMSYSDQIKRFAYTYSSPKSHSLLGTPEGVLWGAHFNNSQGIRISPEVNFGGGVFLTNNPDIVEGTAIFQNQRATMFYVNPEHLNLLDIDRPMKEIDAPELINMLEAENIKYDGETLMSDAIRKLQNSVISRDYEEQLKQAMLAGGFDGVKMKSDLGNSGIQGDYSSIIVFNEALDNIPRFDYKEIALEGNAGLLPWNVPTNYAQLPESTRWVGGKRGALEGDGYVSNGQTIRLDANGSVMAEYRFDEEFLNGYTEIFSKDQIDRINQQVQRFKNPAKLTKEFPDLNKRLISHVKEMQLRSAMDSASFAKAQAEQKFLGIYNHRFMKPEELDSALNDLGIRGDEAKMQFVNDLEFLATEMDKQFDLQIKVERDFNRLEMEQYFKDREVDQKVAEAFDRVQKTLNKPNVKLDEVMYAELKAFETVDKLKKLRPDLEEMIVKATDFCLRRNT